MQTILVGPDNLRVGLLGDPHLGRRFVTDVPLHRRGEHEALVIQGFIAEMDGANDLALHVNMGDLFDRPIVSPETVLLAYYAYRRAVKQNPETLYVVLAGNHDLSRDRETVNSFDVFAELVGPLGVLALREPHTTCGLMFVPFNPWVPTAEVVSKMPLGPYHAVFGHWDLVNPASNVNMVPEMATALYVTGHDHKAREEERHGVRTICTGSMQAYAHGEGEPYRTVTLAELETISPEELKNLCVRVALAQGEELPPGIDALQVGVKREGQAEDIDMIVEFEDFDMATIFTETMTKHGVGSALSETLFERYRSRAS